MNEIAYPEKRLLAREDQILEGLLSAKSCSIHKTFSSYNDQKAVYRYLRNDHVTEAYLLDTIKRSTEFQSRNKRVLAICDTSSINLESNRGRIGKANGKEILGFKLHPIMIEDEMSGACYGFSAIKMYGKALGTPSKDKSKRYEEKFGTEFYTKSRPPGNKTFKEGLDKFDTMMMAYHLFN